LLILTLPKFACLGFRRRHSGFAESRENGLSSRLAVKSRPDIKKILAFCSRLTPLAADQLPESNQLTSVPGAHPDPVCVLQKFIRGDAGILNLTQHILELSQTLNVRLESVGRISVGRQASVGALDGAYRLYVLGTQICFLTSLDGFSETETAEFYRIEAPVASRQFDWSGRHRTVWLKPAVITHAG
jgi:hypothetical protein